jgi:hypothetical protein
MAALPEIHGHADAGFGPLADAFRANSCGARRDRRGLRGLRRRVPGGGPLGRSVGASWRPLLSNGSFGHDGACGQLAFADADANLGFGYVNGSWLAEDVRAERLALALRECLG